MDKGFGSSRTWLWFTVPIAILLAVAAGCGVFISGLYRDVPYFVAQAEGQDLVSLVVVFPLLIITAILAGRGSARARRQELSLPHSQPQRGQAARRVHHVRCS
jgi:hypothetical protein